MPQQKRHKALAQSAVHRIMQAFTS